VSGPLRSTLEPSAAKRPSLEGFGQSCWRTVEKELRIAELMREIKAALGARV
jgi:hypothetical protein